MSVTTNPGKHKTSNPILKTSEEQVCSMANSEPVLIPPKVTIGMPVYNGERFLASAIESALNQSYENLEIVVADNASTDRTEEICREFARIDSRINYVRHPRNIGAAKNYNYVFHCAQGEFFCWLAHDDVLRRDFLKTCLLGFERYGDDAVLVYPNFVYVDAHLNVREVESAYVHATDPSPTTRFRQALDGLGLVTSVFGLYRRMALAKTRLIGSYISSDYVLLVECALLGKVVRLNGEPQFVRRLHDSNSRKANTTPEEVTRWFDPDVTVDARPKRRLSNEYLRSVFSIEGLTYRQRLTIAGYMQSRRIRSRLQTEFKRLFC